MANGANVLVLDEPTNHLDLPAIEQLEAALDGFDGTVLLVTHDRSLLERVRLTRTIELVAGRIARDDSDLTVAPPPSGRGQSQPADLGARRSRIRDSARPVRRRGRMRRCSTRCGR